MLNAFSFTGGFSLYAARGGAGSVTDLDLSEHALAGARRNFALNSADPGVAVSALPLLEVTPSELPQLAFPPTLADSPTPAGAMLPPEHWAGSHELTGVAYDPDRARALLTSAGYGPQRPLTLTYKTSNDAVRIRLATVIQDQLAKVGIQVELKTYDWGTFYGDVKAGRFQLYGLAWVGVNTPDIFRYVFHSASAPPEGANRGRYRNPEVDRLIETARAEPDLGRQAVLYRQIQALILADLPYIPLWYEDQFYAARREVRGYQLAPDGNYDALMAVELNRETLPRAGGK